MENFCNDCNHEIYKESDEDEVNNPQQLINVFNKRLKHKKTFERPIDINTYRKNLYDALLFPEFAKGFKFPATFQIPTYCFQQKSSFSIPNNSTTGNLLIQVNLGQYLDPSNFRSDGTATNFATSNIFYSNNSNTGVSQLADITQANYIALSTLRGPTGTPFTAIRPGPMLVKYEYSGRLDSASGTVTMGIGYSRVSNPTTANFAANAIPTDQNGLLPDLNYSTIQAIEDLPFSRTVSVTENLRAVFVPHDYSLLNLKNPTDAGNTIIPQRLYILVIGNPGSDPAASARITVCSNWEAIPSTGFADILTTSYNENASSNYDGRDVFDYIVKNNLVIAKEDEIKSFQRGLL